MRGSARCMAGVRSTTTFAQKGYVEDSRAAWIRVNMRGTRGTFRPGSVGTRQCGCTPQSVKRVVFAVYTSRENNVRHLDNESALQACKQCPTLVRMFGITNLHCRHAVGSVANLGTGMSGCWPLPDNESSTKLSTRIKNKKSLGSEGENTVFSWRYTY